MKMKRPLVAMMLAAMMVSGQGYAGAADKPDVKVLATGGTIAGSAASDTKTTGYKAGALGIDTLLNAVPEAKNYADLSGEQICSIDSKDMTDDIWLKLAKRCNALLSDKKVDGIVITHGTDTLEETAYFLNLTVKSSKPVVITGAMRPATAISADGPMNLLNAVRIAADKKSAGRGVLVALNDQIDAARNVTKTNTTSVNTFQSPLFGSLGVVNDGVPEFYGQTTRLNTVKSEFDVSKLDKLPYVKVIYGTANDDALFVDAAIKAGVKGIVYAGTGNGSVHKDAEKALAKASAAGIVVVRSTRLVSGSVIPAEQSYIDEHFIDGDSLNPQKCRILLQLALTKTHDLKAIQEMFHKY
ncbi:type II asparaginase, partial [Selenomonas sp.]|uniref:type II asparaginase n=1 Tax=Selenomonas sp. TaxID=2053611 RepID=UPI0025F23FC7